jgi:type III secretion protein R
MPLIENNPINLVLFLSLLGLVPIIVITTTSFIKIAMVLMITRESLSTQQIPPNMVLYSLSLILTFYVMGPVFNETTNTVSASINKENLTPKNLLDSYTSSSSHLRNFLAKHASRREQEFFYQSLKQFWTPEMMSNVKKDDLVILVPAFMISELTQAFKIGFLIYLPSLIIDIIVSNILMAMGMMMMSPVTISLPIKLLLFISLDGWSRLIHALLGSYL